MATAGGGIDLFTQLSMKHKSGPGGEVADLTELTTKAIDAAPTKWGKYALDMVTLGLVKVNLASTESGIGDSIKSAGIKIMEPMLKASVSVESNIARFIKKIFGTRDFTPLANESPHTVSAATEIAPKNMGEHAVPPGPDILAIARELGPRIEGAFAVAPASHGDHWHHGLSGGGRSDGGIAV